MIPEAAIDWLLGSRKSCPLGLVRKAEAWKVAVESGLWSRLAANCDRYDRLANDCVWGDDVVARCDGSLIFATSMPTEKNILQAEAQRIFDVLAFIPFDRGQPLNQAIMLRAREPPYNVQIPMEK
jgi:hypothetical protein